MESLVDIFGESASQAISSAVVESARRRREQRGEGAVGGEGAVAASPPTHTVGLELADLGDIPVPRARSSALARAYAWRDKRCFDDALWECDRAIAADPDFAEAHNLRGIALEGLGEPSKALDAYQEALRLDPTFADAAANLRDLERELSDAVGAPGTPGEGLWGRLAPAGSSAAGPPDQAPAAATPQALLERAYAWQRKGRRAEALHACDEIILQQPGHAGAHNLRGLLLEKLGQPDRALQCYRLAALLDPQLAEAHRNRKKLEDRLRRPDRAVARPQ